jgi:hypothetical protein
MAAASPTPLELVNHRAIAAISIELTPIGMRALSISFPAALGPLLGTTLEYAVAHGRLDPTDAKEVTLHTTIFNLLAPIMNAHPKVLVDMTDACGKRGPKAFVWLTSKYNPTSTASSVTSLMNIFSTQTITSDDDIQKLISINANQPTHPQNLQLDDTILAVLILLKLDQTAFQTLRDSIVISDSVPTVEVLRKRVKDINTFSVCGMSQPHAGGNGAFAGVPRTGVSRQHPCANCGVVGKHRSYECDQPKADCDLCGIGVGHLSQYCFIKTDGPLPPKWTDEQKKAMMEKRATYKATKGQGANAAVGDSDDDEAFWAIIRGIVDK